MIYTTKNYFWSKYLELISQIMIIMPEPNLVNLDP